MNPAQNFCSFLKAAFLPEPERDERQDRDDVDRNCVRAQHDRSEFRRRIRYAAAMTKLGVGLHRGGTISTNGLRLAAYVHLGPILGSARDWKLLRALSC